MKLSDKTITLTDDDLREIFSLFTSATKYEREQAYDQKSEHYFMNVSLADEYSLTEETREFALDAWRSVISFLNLRGYSLCNNGEKINLSFSDEEFIN